MSMNRSKVVGDGVVRTKQEFRESADIRGIIKRAQRGVLPDFSGVQPVFADVSQIPDFHTMQNRIVAANQAFMQLPAELRFRFANQPSNLIAFLQDERNLPEAIQLGLVNKPVEPVAPVVPEVPPKA